MSTTLQSITETCQELQMMQKNRRWYIKSRIMVSNRLTATVAGTMGYQTFLNDNERKKLFGSAAEKIKKLVKGEDVDIDLETSIMIETTNQVVESYNSIQSRIEKEMVKIAKELPVVEWVKHKNQRGFGMLFLAQLIGECGDLANYSTPGKVWKRMGSAPYEKDGTMLAASTWRRGKEGKLTSAEWEEYGYNPRRKSLSFLIGEGLMKQNQEGPYRKRYDQAKEVFSKRHPNHKKDGCQRCHLHGITLAAKLLMKNLWIEWNPELAY